MHRPTVATNGSAFPVHAQRIRIIPPPPSNRCQLPSWPAIDRVRISKTHDWKIRGTPLTSATVAVPR